MQPEMKQMFGSPGERFPKAKAYRSILYLYQFRVRRVRSDLQVRSVYKIDQKFTNETITGIDTIDAVFWVSLECDRIHYFWRRVHRGSRQSKCTSDVLMSWDTNGNIRRSSTAHIFKHC